MNKKTRHHPVKKDNNKRLHRVETSGNLPDGTFFLATQIPLGGSIRKDLKFNNLIPFGKKRALL